MSQPAPPSQTFPEDDLDGRLDETWDDPTEDQPLLSGRRRIRWLSPKSVALLAILTGLVGFYAGIREERSNASGSSSTAAASTSGTAKRGLPSFAGGTTSGTKGTKGAKSSSKTGSFPSFGAGAAAAGGTFGGGAEGTIVSVDGDTLYVKETSGNTVKVKLLSTTTLSKSSDVGSKSLHPGDTVTVDGKTGSRGTITATSVSDSGDSSTSTSSSSSASSSSTS